MQAAELAGPDVSRPVVVAGATGYVGASVAAYLARHGYSVIALVRPESSTALLEAIAPAVRIVRATVSVDGLRQALAEAKPLAVVNLVALFVAEHKPQDVPALLAANLDYPALLLDAADAQGVGVFISAGSFWESWSLESPGPVNLYAAMKRAFAQILAYYADARGMRACHLRLPDVYGPGDPRPKLLQLLRTTARAGKPLAMSEGLQQLDLVHVEDVAEAFRRALEATCGLPPGYAQYGVSHPDRFTLREVVALYGEVIGAEVPVAWGVRPARQREVMRPVALPPVPGWAPRFSLAQGLQQVESAAGGWFDPPAPGRT